MPLMILTELDKDTNTINFEHLHTNSSKKRLEICRNETYYLHVVDFLIELVEGPDSEADSGQELRLGEILLHLYRPRVQR